MMTLNSANTMLDVLAGKSVKPAGRNEDVIAHMDAMAASAPARDAWYLRLLPGFARTPLKAWIIGREYERSLIGLWNVSPHLLADMGVVLTGNGKLPDHLTAAPERVINHVAALAPEQIVAAELSFPPADVTWSTSFATGPAKTKATDAAFALAKAI
jgi:hypothetical protein